MNDTPRAGAFEGPILLVWSSLALAVMTAAVVATHGFGEEGAVALLLATARSSAVFLMGAFLATALRRTWPVPFTAWLLRNRRMIGLSCAISHAIHGVAIWRLVSLTGELPELHILVLTTVGYAALAFLVVTSRDEAVTALGRERWHGAHRAILYYLWFLFFVTFAGSASAGHAVPAVFAVAMLAGLVFRVFALRGRA